MKSNILLIFIIIKVIECVKPLPKRTPKRSLSSNYDGTSIFQPDKNSFPDVIYPTSILDVTKPFYYNIGNDFEITEPFSEDVKSSYKKLNSLPKSGNSYSKTSSIENKIMINDFASNINKNDVSDTERNGTEKNVDYMNDQNENRSFILEETNESDNNTDTNINYDLSNENHDVSSSEDTNVTNIPIYVQINVQVFKEQPIMTTNGDIENKPSLENISDQVNATIGSINFSESHESSEETNSTSGEIYTESQNLNDSDIVDVLSPLTVDFLESEDNVTEVSNITFFENTPLEEIDVFDNSSIPIYLIESDLVLIDENSTLNATEADFLLIYQNDNETILNNDDYFLDFVISLDSICDNNNIAISTYGENSTDFIQENCDIK
ncbi:unnamed protein product [Danaus chrysippus]|uniref:(African queen) hypothetical protein n=1 Tax=Danaus chrysippus TaxID=151541 RepID=A0A8J2R4N0_9NEOP|nr:unnamed protein product [Danaus chrysippus]